jgi:hypothetical protein
MAKGDQINLRPHFKKEGDRLPCDGEAGDLYVFTKLDENDTDPEKFGSAQLWFCTRGSQGERHAVWRRVQFDGYETCDAVPSNLPANPPELKQG